MPAVQPAQPVEPLITLSINAFVIDEIGEPVPDATVSVSRNSTPVASKSSDTAGQVRFEELALQEGIHTIKAAKTDYVPEEQELVVSAEAGDDTRFVVFRLEEIERAALPYQVQQTAETIQPKTSTGSHRVLHEPSAEDDEGLSDVYVNEEEVDQEEDDEEGDEEEPTKPPKYSHVAEEQPPPPTISEEQRYFRVRVYFATDQNRREEQPKQLFSAPVQLNKVFGNERSPDGTLSVGLCDVAVPKSHRMGQMERPSVFKLEFKEAPAKHIVILSVTTIREAYFLESLDMMAGTAPEQDALVFIHGYNVTFAEAVRRTAQIAFDLDFRGIPVCYSWPSSGKYSGYMADEASIEWTIPHLVEFLSKIVRLKNVKTIHLIAHSMGNRALVNCLSRMAEKSLSDGQAQLQQLILAAPDVDAGVFKQLAQTFAKAAKRTTLYASSNDLALQVSQQFHRYPRAGESGPEIVVVPSIDTVDVSEVPSGFLGHSYYGGSRSVLSDVYELIQSDAPPPRFGLRQSTGKDGIYWLFVP
jgi:esterase/lipase superfamily enzyme